jgi:O-antigen ligase
VPCVFSTRLQAVFAVPKLATLWAVLTLGLALAAGELARSGWAPSVASRFAALDVAVAAFVVLNLAAWAASTDRRQSLYGERLQYQGLLTLLLYVGFFALARVAVRDVRQLRTLLVAVVGGATLVSGYALVQRAGLDPVWKGFLPGGRVFGSIGLSNALAAYLVLVLPLAAVLVVATRSPRRRLALIAAGAAIAAAFAFTLSRGGLLGLLAAASVLGGGLHRLGAWSRQMWIALAAALAGVAVVVAVAAPERIAVDPDRDLSLGFHADAWRVAAHVAADHPLLGTGQETFPDVFPRYSHALLPPERAADLDVFRVESPHNVYLGIAAGAGLPALLAYLAVVAAFAAAVLRAFARATAELRLLLVGVLAAVAGHLVTDAFMTPEVTGTWLFWLLLGAAIGALPAGLQESSARSLP